MILIFIDGFIGTAYHNKYWMKNSGSAECDDECTGLEKVS
jgi:hypothetical protein